MKKTLAAVLAAAMALSTATVAFATDVEYVDPSLDPDHSLDSTDSKTYNAKMGGDTKYLINDVTTEDGFVIGADEIAYHMSEGNLTASVLVVSGQQSLSGRPTIKAGNYTPKDPDFNIVTNEVWELKNAYNVSITGKRIRYAKGTKSTSIKELFVDANGDITTDASKVVDIVKGDDLKAAIKAATGDGDGFLFKYYKASPSYEDTSKPGDPEGAIELTVNVPHTYGTSEVPFSLKLRFTAKKDIVFADYDLKKGDTITSEVLNFKAFYNNLTNWEVDMQLTADEVAKNNVLYDGKALAEKLGEGKHFSIAFGDDLAIFSGTTSLSANKLNLYYNTSRNSAIWDAYGLDEYDAEFTFINFLGVPNRRFALSGELMFDASKSADTHIYEIVDGELVPMDGEYDSKYKVVKVGRVRELADGYLISPVELPEEDDEPEAPTDNAPTVEEPEDGNPNTGAC